MCKKFQPVDCVHTLNREWTLYKRMWVTKSQATLESDCHSTNHFLSVNLWCKDLVPQKRGKIKCSECVECFGHWTVFMCWTESGLCTRVMGDFRADPQRSQFHPTNLFLSLNLWCKDLVPQKRGKGIAVSELNILATELSLFAEQRVDFVQENMGD